MRSSREPPTFAFPRRGPVSMLPLRPIKPGAPILALAFALLCAPALAQSVVFSDVHTVAAATQAVPVEESFSVSAAGTYQITLVDLGAQLAPSAPLATVKLAVTSGSALVGTPLLMAGSTTVSATPGNYMIHVVGTPGSVPGSGPIGIQVTNTANNSVVASFSDTLAVPPQPLPSSEAVLDDTFSVAAAGSYTVSIADLQLPQSLGLMTLLLIQQGGTTPLVILPNNGALSASVTLSAGVTYSILAVGQTSSTATGGLFAAVVSPSGGGATVYARTIGVGGTTHVGSPALAAGNYTFKLTDLSTPTALTQLEGVLVLNGSPVATLAAAGSQNFAATAGTCDAFAFAAPSAAPAPAIDAGSYALDVLPQAGGAPALDAARAVATPGGGIVAYGFTASLPSAGSYTLNAADFQLPAVLASLKVLAVQNGAVLGSVSTGAASTASSAISGAAGPVALLAFAQASSAGGLFGADLTASGPAVPVFEVTQGVGAVFAARQFTLTAAGNYSATASDLAFPLSFANFDVIITQGTTLVGSIFGGGTFFFQGTPGSYFINFVAQSAGSDHAGTYALTVTTAPPAPTISLSVDHPSVASGSTVDLTWSTQNATTCTASPASGGWTGSLALSGVATTGPLTADTTFTLQCTGAGGSLSQSIKVMVTPASSGGRGGGGTADGLLLATLGVVLLLRSLWGNAGRPAVCYAAVLVVALTATLSLGGCGGAQSRYAAHMKRGQDYFAAADYSRANVEFRNAMQIRPRDAAARIMAARTYEKQTRLREAIGLYQSAVDTAPENSEARANLARLLVFAGAADQAMKILEPALKSHADDPLLLTLRGTARQRLGDQAGAVADIDRALKLDPANAEAIEARAGMYRSAGDVAAATALIVEALARQPTSTELHEVLADLYTAGAEPAKAEAELRKLIELSPREPRYRYQLASFYASDQRLDEAQRVLEAAVAALPANNEVRLALVEFVSAQRTRAQGEQLLRDFIARDPGNNELRLGLGQLLQRSGALPEAIAAYQDVAQRDPTGPQGLAAQDRLARIAIEQGRTADADKLVAKVLEASPRDSDALLLRGELALARGNPTAAVTDLRAVLRDEPQALAVYRLLANALVQTGDAALAEETLRNALVLAPTDIGLRVDLGKVLLQTQRADQAVSLLEEVVQHSPADAAAREELVMAHLARHDYDAARTAAEDLIRLRPEGAPGPYLAGLAAEGLKHPDEAQKDFLRALSLKPRAFDVLAALSRLMLSRGQAAEAVGIVTRAAAAGPADARILNLLGETCLAAHDVPAATDALTRATTAAPAWWIPYRNLALARASARDSAGVIAAYEGAIKAGPHEEQPVAELAVFYEQNRRPDDAIALYDRWNRENPRDQLIANNLAMALVRYRSDRVSLDRARDLSTAFSDSSDGQLLDTNGWVHFKRAEYAEALQILKRALERSPDSREIRYHLGMAEWRSGNAAQARKDLEAALAGSAKFAGADDARAALAALAHTAG